MNLSNPDRAPPLAARREGDLPMGHKYTGVDEMKAHLIQVSILSLTLGLVACGGGGGGDEIFDLPANFDPDAPYTVNITGGDLDTDITNQYFPAPIGATWTYEAQTDEGTEHTDVEVLAQTKDVWGATATVVHDTVYLNGEMIEDTWDWYGQDAQGNVWYLGEETYEYENGVVVSSAGAWESGVNGALPGYIMLANPQVGDAYRQEYLAGEAEDLAEIVELNVTVSVAAGEFIGCVKTREVSVIDRSYEEFKYSCPGIGVVLEEAGDDRVELIAYSGLTPM
jgi:hypothetical protein